MLPNLEKYKILLASHSPRRRELLSQLRVPFNTIGLKDIDETYPETLPAEDVPQFLANKKADAYSRHLKQGDLLITADTLVILDEKILGKPKDHDAAVAMLHELSGKQHRVVSGVCVTTASRRITFSTVTDVKFAELEDCDIEYYVNNFQPYDKAGGYGIQEWIGYVAVEWIRGSYYNVMGLPVHQLYEELKHF